MTSPHYSIDIRGDVLCARMHNKAQLDKDLQYLLDFATAAQSMRNRPWGILSDMSHWPAHEIQLKDTKLFEDFDRRNQIAECWIVRDDKQGARLIPLFKRYPAIKFIRVKTLDEARAWFLKQPLFFDDTLPWDNF